MRYPFLTILLLEEKLSQTPAKVEVEVLVIVFSSNTLLFEFA